MLRFEARQPTAIYFCCLKLILHTSMQVEELNNLRVQKCGIKKGNKLASQMILTNTQWCNNYNIKIKKLVFDQKKDVLYSF
jgi:hypothetical protein